MIPVAGQIIGEPYARAEALTVIVRLLGHQGRRQGAARIGSRLELLKGAALGNIRAADEIDILVIPKPEIDSEAMGQLPVILEVQSELLRVLDEERGVAHRDAHAGSSRVASEQARSLKSLRQGQNLAG